MKYKQRGYQDDDGDGRRGRPERSEWQDRPRRDPDLPGGRLADPQRVIRNLRCHHCGDSVPLEQDSRGDIITVKRDASCGRCGTAVHSCRNCLHFDPDRHLECRKPIKVGFKKIEANDCEYFEPKVVVEMTRDASRSEGSFAPTASSEASPRNKNDARKAFDDLFK